MFCGNGGSAADAQHLAAEYVVRFGRERGALGALALTTDTSVLTAGGNDYGYETIFERQVRDALAYQRMPEQASAISVIYVNDMGAASSWEQPGATNWIKATEAHYVIGSSRRGGMGAPELVPFRARAAADTFASEHGGRVIGYGEITDEMVLSPVEIELPEPSKPIARESHDGHGERDG